MTMDRMSQSESFNLLRQVRSAIGMVAQESARPDHQSLLNCADVVLNELMLRTEGAFYVDYIGRGRKLVEEGRQLARSPFPDCLAEGAHNLHPQASPDVFADALRDANRSLALILGELGSDGAATARDFATRVTAWEAELYERGLSDAGGAISQEPSPFTRDAFEAYLRHRLPDRPNLRITEFTPLVGGFSKRTVRFAIEDDRGMVQTLILRAEQAVSLPRFSNIIQEYNLIRYAVDAGLPTPDALWLETDETRFGVPFAVMENAAGSNYGWTMGRTLDPPPELVDSIIDTLCAMHRVPLRANDPRLAASHLAQWLRVSSLADNTRRYVAEYMPKLIASSQVEPTPQLVRALEWLKANVPDVAAQPVLVHLDFGLNNILIEENRVSAILDWESARIGDPCDDILVMQRELAAHVSMEQFLERYCRGTGRSISAYNLAYAQVAAAAMYLIIYLNGRQKLLRDPRTPIAMSLLAFRYIAMTASRLDELIAAAERAK